ncbi:MAG: type III pantothenate kinase [Firmicutes bacterium]|jgi:type III pantothenate kinase|nr:type III pantothenate kinase [Bacillota bacterium]
MLLAIDVGNSYIMLGVFENNKMQICWRMATKHERTEDELGIMIKNLFLHSNLEWKAVTGIAISSVVPPLMHTLEKMSQKYFELYPLVVGPGVKTGLNILMDDPREVGADRVVNAVAAYTLYGGPTIIVDFGTATTFCVINEKGDYLGGAIAPGIGISTEALFTKAAKLPRVELAKPKRVIGKNTISSMQSGIIYGLVGQVDGIVRRICRELSSKPFVVATGGYAEFLASESETIEEVNYNLTLEGLKIIYNRQKERNYSAKS